MAAERTVTVKIKADGAAAEKALKGAEKAVKSFGDSADKANRKAGALDKVRSNLLTDLVDKVPGASRALDKFGVSAEDAAGKLGQGGLLGVTGLATAGVAAAGVAVFAAAKKFTDAATEVERFSQKTGIAVEPASRLMEVAGDLGVSMEAAQSGLGQFAKRLDPKKLQEFGIAVAQAKDGSVDLIGTIGNVATKFAEIRDPVERARLGNQLFGKSWQELAPVLERGRDLLGDLKDVGAGQVFTQEEIDKARKMRESMQALNDSLDKLTMDIGAAAAPAVAELADGVRVLTDGLGKLKDGLDSIKPGLSEVSLFGGTLGNFKKMWDGLFGKDKADDARGMGQAIRGTTRAAIEYTGAVSDAVDETNRWITSVRKAVGDNDDYRRAILDVEDALDGYAQRAASAAEKGGTNAEANRDLTRSELDLKQRLLEAADAYAKQTGASGNAVDAAVAQRNELTRLLDKYGSTMPALRAEIQAYIDKLNAIPSVRETTIRTQYFESHSSTPTRTPVPGRGGPVYRASGGPVSAGMPYIVGEHRPELFVPDVSGRIVPSVPNGGDTYVVNVTAGMGADANEIGRVIVQALRTEKRRGTPMPWN